MKKTACLTLCIYLFVFTASFASAQLLDDLWFQVKFKAKGFVYRDTPNIYYPASTDATGYFHLTWVDTSSYTATVYSYYDNVWHHYDSFWHFVGENEDFFYEDMYINDCVVKFVAIMNIKRTASGPKVSLKGKACFVVDGSIEGVGSFYGSCKLSGKTIDRGKLPFTP